MADLLKDVSKFVSKYNDTHTYSQIEWLARGEDMCANAEVSFVAEGELYHLLNGTNQRSVGHKKTWAKLKKIADKYNCYVEQGFSWSWHFIKVV